MVEHLVVAQEATGSSPVDHPNYVTGLIDPVIFIFKPLMVWCLVAVELAPGGLANAGGL